ncbi:BppU family phage baseplate upper protein [Garciella nitratireducens]|uniref:BppU N-terminal domain-containing protein n=1 Tax=Garciella nitratireducens DSM 15102 TaxID=1121911 RepID=A0A1T4K5N9_9FIRM|nr:BppU family phage baseplate upper protein [Garciella nitratireducens]SJZ37778.1 hypothetical protein SAMN02745973_00361 [Garciella nitratireducens DSM 15102]
MALDNFRRVDIRLDKANAYIPENLFAKEGDYNGRELLIQLTNGGQETDTTGVQVIFNWKHLQKGHSGSTYFQEEDVTKGKYVVAYPTQMLFAGLVTCWFSVVDNGKITNTKNITLTVEKGDNGDLIVAENDFSILQDALIQINQYQNEIDAIKTDLQVQADNLLATEKAELDDLEANYAPKLQALETQFNDTIENVTVDSEVITARTSLATGISYDTLALILEAIENRQLIHDPVEGKFYIETIEIVDGKEMTKIEEVM